MVPPDAASSTPTLLIGGAAISFVVHDLQWNGFEELGNQA